MASDAEWVLSRQRAAQVQAAALAQSAAAEQAQAAALLDWFTGQLALLPTQPAPYPLTALGFSSNRRYRTNQSGWYLNQARSCAVNAAGEYFSLVVPDQALGRLRGVAISPQPAPLVIGRGSRDGESMDLKTALTKLLAQLAGQ